MADVKFTAAVNVIRSLPKDGPYQPSHEMMLKFYGLYKQATEGPCDEPKPSFYEVVKGYKWRAWSALGDMPNNEAMDTYVEELKKIIETMSYSTDVASFMETLGPFYEYVEVAALKTSDKNHNITHAQSKGFGNHVPSNAINDVSSCNGGNPDVVGANADDATCLREERNTTTTVTEVRHHHQHRQDFDVISNGDPLVSESNGFCKGGAPSCDLSSVGESDDEYTETLESPDMLLNRDGGDAFAHNGRSLPLYAPLKSPFPLVSRGGGDTPPINKTKEGLPYRGNFPIENPQRSSKSPNIGGCPRPRRFSGGSGGGNGEGNFCGVVSSSSDLRRIYRELSLIKTRLEWLERGEVCPTCRRGVVVTSRNACPDGSAFSSLWPFPELSPRTGLALLVWPFLLQGAAKLLRILRQKASRREVKRNMFF